MIKVAAGVVEDTRGGDTGRTNGNSPLDGSREGIDYTGRSRWVYQELRDRKAALFVDKLPEGFWEIGAAETSSLGTSNDGEGFPTSSVTMVMTMVILIRVSLFT